MSFRKYLLLGFMLLGCKCGSVSVCPAINKRSREFYQDLKLISVGDTYSCKDIMKSINRTKVTFQQAAGEDGKQTIERGDRARTARGTCTPRFRCTRAYPRSYIFIYLFIYLFIDSHKVQGREQ